MAPGYTLPPVQRVARCAGAAAKLSHEQRFIKAPLGLSVLVGLAARHATTSPPAPSPLARQHPPRIQPAARQRALHIGRSTVSRQHLRAPSRSVGAGAVRADRGRSTGGGDAGDGADLPLEGGPEVHRTCGAPPWPSPRRQSWRSIRSCPWPRAPERRGAAVTENPRWPHGQDPCAPGAAGGQHLRGGARPAPYTPTRKTSAPGTGPAPIEAELRPAAGSQAEPGRHGRRNSAPGGYVHRGGSAHLAGAGLGQLGGRLRHGEDAPLPNAAGTADAPPRDGPAAGSARPEAAGCAHRATRDQAAALTAKPRARAQRPGGYTPTPRQQRQRVGAAPPTSWRLPPMQAVSPLLGMLAAHLTASALPNMLTDDVTANSL